MKYQKCNIEKFLFNGKYVVPAVVISVDIQFLHNKTTILSELDFAIGTILVVNNHELKIVDRTIHINNYSYICDYIKK